MALLPLLEYKLLWEHKREGPAAAPSARECCSFSGCTVVEAAAMEAAVVFGELVLGLVELMEPWLLLAPVPLLVPFVSLALWAVATAAQGQWTWQGGWHTLAAGKQVGSRSLPLLVAGSCLTNSAWFVHALRVFQ